MRGRQMKLHASSYRPALDDISRDLSVSRVACFQSLTRSVGSIPYSARESASPLRRPSHLVAYLLHDAHCLTRSMAWLQHFLPKSNNFLNRHGLLRKQTLCFRRRVDVVRQTFRRGSGMARL